MSSLYLLNHRVSDQLKLVRNQAFGIITMDTELAHRDQGHLTDYIHRDHSILTFKLFQVILGVSSF